MSLNDKRAVICAALLLGALALQALSAAHAKSPTADEFSHHIASGYSYLMTGDFRMNPASPPLPRLLSAVPLFFLGVRAPLDHSSWREGDSPAFAREFFYRANPGLDRLVFWARIPTILLSLAFGGALFFWTRRLFGNAAAVAALALYVFSPDVVAHSALATADLPVALFFFLAVVCFWRHLEEGNLKTALVTGLFAGLALLSKFSAALLFPTLLLVALLSGRARRLTPRNVAAFFVVIFLTVWTGYFFETKPLLRHTPEPEKKAAVFRRLGGEGFVRFAETVPVPLATFATALPSMAVTRALGTNAYLLGEWSRTGWWYYYFVAFAVKNTLPFLFLLAGAVASARRLFGQRVAAAALFATPLVFFLATLGDKAQAGIRYFLPVYPFFFMVSGVFAALLWRKGGAAKVLVAALLGWHALEAVLVCPDYLAYFNQLAGGRGYRVLRDSNVEWGQDLRGLAAFAREKGYPEVAIASLAPVDLDYYGVRRRLLRPEEYERPEAAVYAIGAHFMDVVRWTASTPADRVIGRSIHVYDMRQRAGKA